jgi:Arc/MetJ-type ribon-helix-helix transcriptional regulator
MKSEDFTAEAAKISSCSSRKKSRFADADVALGNAKVVKTTFSLPPEEYAALDVLRGLAASEYRYPSQSELIRAGLLQLQGLSSQELGAALDQIKHLSHKRQVI